MYVPFLDPPSSSWVRDDEGVILKWRSHKKLLYVTFKFRQVIDDQVSYMTLVGRYTQEQIDDLGIEVID